MFVFEMHFLLRMVDFLLRMLDGLWGPEPIPPSWARLGLATLVNSGENGDMAYASPKGSPPCVWVACCMRALTVQHLIDAAPSVERLTRGVKLSTCAGYMVQSWAVNLPPPWVP